MANKNAKSVIKTKKFKICVSIFSFILVACLVSLIFADSIERMLGIGQGKLAGLDEVYETEFQAHFIAVGQGSASFYVFPDGKNMLVDSGLDNNKSKNTLVSYLKRLDVSKIDYFVVTHSDADHVGGADKIFSEFEVKTIYRPFIVSSREGDFTDPLSLAEYDMMSVGTAVYAKFVELAYSETYDENTPSQVIVFSDQVKLFGLNYMISFHMPRAISDVELSLINLDGSGFTTGFPVAKESNTNDMSPFILFQFLGKSIVLTGDAGSAIENKFLNSASDLEIEMFTDATIYIAGHHGSNYSSNKAFLSLLSAEYIVVQCGDSNSHPHSTFLERVDEVWSERGVVGNVLRTDNHGSVAFGFKADDDLRSAEVLLFTEGETSIIKLRWWNIAVGIIVFSGAVLIIPLIPKERKQKVKKTAKAGK